MKETTMKKKLYFTMLLAGLVFAGCSSDDAPEQNPVEPAKTYYMSVDASKDFNDAASRLNRALTLTYNTLTDKNSLTPSWAVGEKVYVYAHTAYPKFWFEGYLEAKSAGTTTQLNGALSLPGSMDKSTLSSLTEFTLVFPRPSQPGNLDYTEQIGTLEDIAAKYDYAVANVEFTIVEGNHIVAIADNVIFKSQQAIVKFTLKDKADEGATLLNATSLEVSVGSDTYTITPASATSEIYVAIPGFSTKNVTLTATVGGNTYTYEKASVSFLNGKYYEIGVKMTKQP